MRILIAFAISITLNGVCWGQSARDVVLSFVGSQMSEMKSNPKIRFDESDPRRYAAAWPQISHSNIRSQGGHPSKVTVDIDGRISKYLVVSQSNNDVTIFFSDDRITDASLSFGPDTIVGMEITFKTVIAARDGRKIILNLDPDKKTGRFASQDSVTWRDYIERGYKDRIASVYSIRPQRTPESSSIGQLCEAQKATCLASCPRDRVLTTQLDATCSNRCQSVACN